MLLQTLLEECEQALDGMDGVTAMHADFYKVQADYFKVYDDMYCSEQHILMSYRSRVTSTRITQARCATSVALTPISCPVQPCCECRRHAHRSTDLEKATRAFDLGLSALVGKNVYNFGELVICWRGTMFI